MRGFTKEGSSLEMEESVIWCLRAGVALGDAEAQRHLGLWYLQAKVPQMPGDAEKGVSLLRRAAAQGDATAAQELSKCYFHGRGVTPNGDLYVHWLRTAADAGSVEAIKEIFTKYYGPNFVPPDPASTRRHARPSGQRRHQRSKH